MLSFIIVYKQENDETKACIRSIYRSLRCLNHLPRFEILKSTKPNISFARNDLVNQSKGDILVFLDGDAQASDFWLHELLKPFKDPKVGVVGGCNILKQNASVNEVLADKILTFPLATWKSRSRYQVVGKIREVDESELTTCNLAIRKQAFLEVGGFPVNFIPCEENVLLNNIALKGWKMIYNPLSIVFHSRDPYLIPHLQKMFYYAKGRAKMIKQKKGGIKFLPSPSLEMLYVGFGLFMHYLTYLSGLCWGLLTE